MNYRVLNKRCEKTHCPHGHEYTVENTYIYKNCRSCKQCGKIRDKLRKEKLRQQKIFISQ